MKPEPDNEQLFNPDTSETEVLPEIKPETKTNQGQQNRVLVVEDNPLNSLFITAGLHVAKIPFIIVSGEREAMSEIRRQHFDIIIIGVNDPENSKYELFNRYKGESLQKTYLIAITCQLTRRHISDERLEIFDHILINPYSIQELRQQIIECMNSVTTKSLVPDHKPSFNLEQLQKISNNNEEFITKMLDKFVITALECSESLAHGVDDHDREKVRKAAHKAIPSYAIMGLNVLVGHLENLEANAPSISEESLQNIIAQFATENKQTILDIKDYQKHLRK